MLAKVHIVQGDITAANVDVIVNAANPKMLGGGGVDGAIHRAAGPDLLAQCRKVKSYNGVRCPVGEARITSAGALNARYVIHTVGPRYHRDQQPEQRLVSAYTSSLALALEHQCSSIAFPAISCGAYGYPIDEAAEIALEVCSSAQYSNLDISFYLFGALIYDTWRARQEALIKL